MSERKVLNKYYPPDYDPSKIPKGKRNRNATFNIRIMAPFNMRCNMCKEYIYKGKKFNSRKEDVEDEDYLGLKIFRFYIKCPRCVSEIAFKTDLKNTDYTLEAGAKRLFEAEKIAQQMAEEERKAKEEEEMNPMKLLENRTKQSRQEMEQIDTLEELREMNTRKNLVNTDEMIETYRKYEELLAQLQMEREEQEIKEIFGDKSGQVVKRLNDSDSDEDQPARKKLVTAVAAGAKPTDILSEDSTTAAKPKKPQVWEKSVGSLSTKQKLKGLVAVKKKNSVQVPSATMVRPTSMDGESSGNSDRVSSKGDAKSEGTDTGISYNQDRAKSEVMENGQMQNNTAAECKKSDHTVTEKNDNSAQAENEACVTPAAEGKGASDSNNVVKVQVANTVSKPTGSGLLALGAYSDSESDNSD